MGQLILTRRIGESVEIHTAAGQFIQVTLHKVNKNQACLCFFADNDVIIHRTEIANKIRAEEHRLRLGVPLDEDCEEAIA